MLLGLVVIGEETKDTTVVRANRLVFSKSKKVSLLGITGGVRVLKTGFFLVGLWSQSADKLTIHSLPCSWIL